MENQKKPKWITTSHFNFDFFSFSSACESYKTSMKKLLGFPFNYKYQNLDIYYDENDFIAHENMLSSSPELIKEQIDFIETVSDDLVTASKKYGQSVSLNDLGLWRKTYVEFLPTLGIVVAPERVLTKKIKSFLSEDDFRKISFSEETSTAKELNSLMEIALLSLSKVDIDKLIDDHIEKFGWLGNKWMTFAPFTKKDIFERLGTVGDKAAEKIKSMADTRKKMDQDLRGVLVGLSNEQRYFVEQYRRLLYWRTGRGEAAALSCSLTLPLFTWAATKIGLDRGQVVRYSFEEITELIEKDRKAENPETRKYFDAVMVDGDLRVEWRVEET